LDSDLEAARVEPFPDLRDEPLTEPFAEPADLLEWPLAVAPADSLADDFPWALPLALAFPAGFADAFGLLFPVDTFLAAADFDEGCRAAERFGGVARTKARSETRTKPNFKREHFTIAV
jgi:hypothetical protein